MAGHRVLLRQFDSCTEAGRVLTLGIVCVGDGLLGWDKVRLLDVRLPALVEICLILGH